MPFPFHHPVMYPFTKIPVVIDPELCDTHPDLKVVKLDDFQKISM